MSLARYHPNPTALAKTRAVVSLQSRSAATTHIVRTLVRVALFPVPNHPSLNMTKTRMITNIILQKDVQHAACQTSALTHHINILVGTMISSLRVTHRGMDTCIHPI